MNGAALAMRQFTSKEEVWERLAEVAQKLAFSGADPDLAPAYTSQLQLLSWTLQLLEQHAPTTWRQTKDAAHRGLIVARTARKEYYLAGWLDSLERWHIEGFDYMALDEFERRFPEYIEVPS